jgi:RNA exonuclease 4
MAPTDLTQLSSNWKILQEKLKQEKPASTPLKRKSADEDDTKRVVKRQKVQAGHTNGTRMAPPHSKAKKIRPRSKSIPSKRLSGDEEAERPATSHGDHEAIDDEAQVNEGVSPTAIAGKYIALDCEMVGFGPTPGTLRQSRTQYL